MEQNELFCNEDYQELCSSGITDPVPVQPEEKRLNLRGAKILANKYALRSIGNLLTSLFDEYRKIDSKGTYTYKEYGSGFDRYAEIDLVNCLEQNVQKIHWILDRYGRK